MSCAKASDTWCNFCKSLKWSHWNSSEISSGILDIGTCCIWALQVCEWDMRMNTHFSWISLRLLDRLPLNLVQICMEPRNEWWVIISLPMTKLFHLLPGAGKFSNIQWNISISTVDLCKNRHRRYQLAIVSMLTGKTKMSSVLMVNETFPTH